MCMPKPIVPDAPPPAPEAPPSASKTAQSISYAGAQSDGAGSSASKKKTDMQALRVNLNIPDSVSSALQIPR